MIRNTVVNTLTFYYPLGNTPAVCLTQDLPPEQDASILLLGCGDVRNILFTTFADPGRRLDATCVDIEPAVLARNILVLSLIADAKAEEHHIWSIYYHIKLNKSEVDVLQQQLSRLLSLSESRTQWDDGPFGSWLAFSDQRTFETLRQLWSVWLSSSKSAEQDSKLDKAHARMLNIRRKFVDDDMLTFGCARSASPLCLAAIKTLPKLAGHWWKTGIVDQDKHKIAEAVLFNPSFLITSNSGVVLHYGQEPLNGFPLAPAYVSLDKRSVLFTQPSDLSFEPAIVAARKTFSAWSQAFRRSLELGSVLRFCAADTLSMCHTLQNTANQSDAASANLSYDNWCSQRLEIDCRRHKSRRVAPSRFSVIDISNLIDHLGALNIIVAAAPLLVPALSSTLYTKVLVENEENHAKQLNTLLCNDFKTMSILLGVSPVELWTNATGNNEADQGMLNASLKLSTRSSGRGKQSMTRVRWKLLPNQDSPSVTVESKPLAELLSSTYNTMFRHEDVKTLFSSMSHEMSILSNPYYTRAGFAALIKFVKNNVVADWDQVTAKFLEQLVAMSPLTGVTTNFLADLKTALFLAGLTPPEIISSLATTSGSKSPALSPVMSVTIVIPRKAFNVVSDMQEGTIGIPVLAGAIWFRDSSGQQPNYFSGVQVGFGRIAERSDSSEGESGKQIEIIDVDECGWAGQSPVVVSFLCPSSLLLARPTATVGIRLQPTPQSLQTFGRKLGPELGIFACSLNDHKNVHITRFQPGHQGLPVLGGPQAVSGDKTAIVMEHSTSVSLQLERNVLSTIVGRIDLISDAAKKNLEDRNNTVSVKFLSPLAADVTIGKKHYPIQFPSPVAGSKYKARIARTSSYVELLVPLWDPLGPEAFTFIFPTSLIKTDDKLLPVSWNSQRVNLDRMPKIEIQALAKGQGSWLNLHMSLAWSDRERQIREAGLGTGVLAPNTRVELKEGLFSMLLQYTGIQGHKAEVFGLSKEGSGVHALLFPAALRLDLVNRSVVLDTAIIPLTPAILQEKKFMSFVQAASERGIMQIRVSDEELRCWKSIMPAMVERCRNWSHTAKCEYAKANAVPLTLEDNKSPLCSCGVGVFPPNYMQTSASSIPHFEHALKRYATRAAISPIFAVSYVESCFLAEHPKDSKSISNLPSKPAPDGTVCQRCGTKGHNNGTATALMQCARCKKVKYCSRDCQKADWSVHKRSCASI